MDPTALLTSGLISGAGGGGAIIIRYFGLDAEGEYKGLDVDGDINLNQLEGDIRLTTLEGDIEFFQGIGYFESISLADDIQFLRAE